MTDTSKCTNPDHDHELTKNDVPGRCNGCGLPAHYDWGTDWYHHDDPNAPLCFLTLEDSVPIRTGKTPCTTP